MRVIKIFQYRAFNQCVKIVDDNAQDYKALDLVIVIFAKSNHHVPEVFFYNIREINVQNHVIV